MCIRDSPDGSAVRLTVSRYYTPSGRCIQKSYEDGLEAYQQEKRDRFANGELTNLDSIHPQDTMKFYTMNKRVVYGGGGIMPDELLDGLSYVRREEQWQRDIARGNDAFVIVAEDAAGQLVGFADGGPERKGDRDYSGEVSALYVDPAHTGRGIGRKLLRAGASELRNRGHRAMLVWVLVENPACGFYEAMGGALLYERMITIGGANLRARAYGWRDIEVLADQR